MAVNKNERFGAFLQRLSENRNGAPSNAAVEAVKAKIEKQKAEEIEVKLMQIHRCVETQVNHIRQCRKSEKNAKAEIEKLVARAEAIIEGKPQECDE